MSIQSHSQSGKVALVTGSSRGIGAGSATRLARSGVHVIINYRARSDAAERLVQGLRIQG
jgi:NAD(P)-dependent dehydrogenase (short-subunit alcohol dehydrogenase family)